jgi:type IV pilus assembly protein PilQ
MKKLTLFRNICVFLAASLASITAMSSTLDDISVSTLPGGVTELALSFDGQPPEPKSYSIDQPARISLDLAGVQSGLKKKYHNIGSGNARSATVVGTKDKTRVIVNLAEMVKYSSRIEGNTLYLVIGETGTQAGTENNTNVADTDNADTGSDYATPSAKPANKFFAKNDTSSVDVDFRRSEAGEGQLIISLTDSNAPVDIEQQGDKVKVSFPSLKLPENLQRRLDVTDFATPVTYVDASTEENHAVFYVETSGAFDYLAYQADETLTITLKPLTKQENERRKLDRFPFNGEKLSLNFQSIEVRSVLQLIADFTDLNLVASDSVAGSITLRLRNVPWDQALELVLKTKGLAKRKVGNVLLVAPAEEIAEQEKLELEANKQVAELAPLQTEFLQVRYAKALKLSALISAEQGLLSERGSAVVDERTNTILLQDTAANLQKVREAVGVLDVPVRQVLIEARIVIARTSVGEDLGVRWGGKGFNNANGRAIAGGGNINSVNEGRTIISSDIAGNARPTINTTTDDLFVDFAVADSRASSFAVGVQAFDYLLDLELSALETSGNADIVSQPRVITADGQTAKILSGVEIPYEEASSSGATTISFREAVLKLEVTPQITPDDRIIMDLLINQDSIGEQTLAGPAIDTNEIETQVLVSNGETIVLGGIFKTEEITSVSKTPFLGDLPLIGALVRNTHYEEFKSELLIFITPRLVKDTLTVR